jgi:hypothetical protein
MKHRTRFEFGSLLQLSIYKAFGVGIASSQPQQNKSRSQTSSYLANYTGEWSSRQNYLPTRNQPVVLSHAHQRIPSHYIKRLRDAITSQSHRIYFQQRYRWDDYVYRLIAWDALFTIGRRSSSLPSSGTRSKLVHNWLNLGTQRAKFHPLSSEMANQCPYCQLEETFTHLMTCPDPRAKKCRFEASSNLRKGLSGFSGGTTLLQSHLRMDPTAYTAAAHHSFHSRPSASCRPCHWNSAPHRLGTYISWIHKPVMGISRHVSGFNPFHTTPNHCSSKPHLRHPDSPGVLTGNLDWAQWYAPFQYCHSNYNTRISSQFWNPGAICTSIYLYGACTTLLPTASHQATWYFLSHPTAMAHHHQTCDSATVPTD